MKMAIAIVALVACKVPDVDLTGKHCPCASGYTCDDTTQLCVQGDIADAPPDTTMPSSSCLADPMLTIPVFSDSFSSLDAWNLQGGTWVAINGQAQQQDDTATLAYAFPTTAGSAQASAYRIVATMHQLAHVADNSAFEIAFRIVQQVVPDIYHCNFEPNDHTLVIQHTTGAQTPVLVSSVVDVDPQYDPNATFTLEVLVQATTATCCVRELPGASLTTTSINNPNGPPGMKTFRMSAGYGAFQVFH
ncbi:MAG TPA: hypothetical protein VGO00_05140 [Kofleriaceae bacterium]|nr:hypothetical protein [Kofleriaceae bacterium]